jgi:hypothetical protein
MKYSTCLLLSLGIHQFIFSLVPRSERFVLVWIGHQNCKTLAKIDPLLHNAITCACKLVLTIGQGDPLPMMERYTVTLTVGTTPCAGGHLWQVVTYGKERGVQYISCSIMTPLFSKPDLRARYSDKARKNRSGWSTRCQDITVSWSITSRVALRHSSTTCGIKWLILN